MGGVVLHQADVVTFPLWESLAILFLVLHIAPSLFDAIRKSPVDLKGFGRTLEAVAGGETDIEEDILTAAPFVRDCKTKPSSPGKEKDLDAKNRRKQLAARMVNLRDSLMGGQAAGFRHEARDHVMNDPDFEVDHKDDDLPMAAIRRRTERQMRSWIQRGPSVSVNDIVDNAEKFIAAHEVLAGFGDPSLVYSFSVHFNLWGGSLLKLGSEEQRNEWLSKVDKFDGGRGAFALTEVRHGVSSGLFVDTWAKYDAKSQSFTLHTPSEDAMKNWISFAACGVNDRVAGQDDHLDWSRHAIVFAELIDGDDNKQGIHAFLVPLSDSKGNITKGVEVIDMGHKPCINGNDNARLRFTNTVIPRESLLSRFSQVSVDGNFTSSIEKPKERFMKAADQLMSGRTCIMAASIVLAKKALTSAVAYTCSKRQNRGPDQPTMPLYMLHHVRRALVAHCAKLYTVSMAVNEVKREYAASAQRWGAERPTELTLAINAFKSYCTLYSTELSATSRNLTGAQGLLSCNALHSLVGVAQSLVVVEGDALILAQTVAKSLLRLETSSGKKSSAAKYITLQAKAAYFRALHALDTPADMATVMHRRYIIAVADLAKDMRSCPSRGQQLEWWQQRNLSSVLRVAKVWTEWQIMERSCDAIVNIMNDSTRELFLHMRDLYAAHTLANDSVFASAGRAARLVARCEDACSTAARSVSTCQALILSRSFDVECERSPMIRGECL